MIYLILYLAVNLLWIIYEFWAAPYGYQDKFGFHNGPPPDDYEED